VLKRQHAGPRGGASYTVNVLLFLLFPMAGILAGFVVALAVTSLLYGDVKLVLANAAKRTDWALINYAIMLSIPIGAASGILAWYFVVYRTGFVREEQANRILKPPPYVPFSQSTLGRCLRKLLDSLRGRRRR